MNSKLRKQKYVFKENATVISLQSTSMESNLTVLKISLLRANNFKSPFISMTASSGKQRVSVGFASIYEQYSHFIVGSTQYFGLTISNCLFANSISSTVWLSDKYYNVTNQIVWANSSEMSIRCCTFYSLSSSSNGGAIYADVSSLNAMLTSCVFMYCHAYYGGAIYLTCGNFTEAQCYMDSCYCVSFGMISYIPSSTNITVMQCTHTKCPNSTSYGYRDSMFLVSPYFLIEYLNCSNDYTAMHTTFAEMWAYTLLSSSFCQISNDYDTLGALINFQETANPYTLSYFNIISNYAGSTYGLFWTDRSADYVSMHNFVLYNNTFSTFLMSGNATYPSFYDCHVDFALANFSNCITSNIISDNDPTTYKISFGTDNRCFSGTIFYTNGIGLQISKMVSFYAFLVCI